MTQITSIDEDPSTLLMMLPNGILVEKGLHDELRRHIESAIPRLEFDVEYQIQHLVPAEAWKPRSDGVRRNLGRCLAYWVSTGQVDLEFVGCRRCNRKRYRRKR